MTPQQIFDIIVSHLRKQGKHSKNSSGRCAYRGLHGCKCAIGCLIPDEEYAIDLEGGTLDDILGSGLLSIETEDLLSSHRKLLAELQLVHDSDPVSDWEYQFKNIARFFGLMCK